MLNNHLRHKCAEGGEEVRRRRAAAERRCAGRDELPVGVKEEGTSYHVVSCWVQYVVSGFGSACELITHEKGLGHVLCDSGACVGWDIVYE